MMNLESTPGEAPGDTAESRLIQDFVEHWGLMARSWGINSTMGELFALLFVTGLDMTADELRERLKISRGNASMNLRELMSWGVVHRVHRQGQRREYYRAEGNVWTLFRRIVQERKRRELDPTLDLLEQSASSVDAESTLPPTVKDRVSSLLDFFRLVDSITNLVTANDPADLRELLEILQDRPGSQSQPSNK